MIDSRRLQYGGWTAEEGLADSTPARRGMQVGQGERMVRFARVVAPLFNDVHLDLNCFGPD